MKHAALYSGRPWYDRSASAHRPLFKAGGRVVGLQVGGVDHQNLAIVALRVGQFLNDAFEHAVF